jgi:hypothetical protein
MSNNISFTNCEIYHHVIVITGMNKIGNGTDRQTRNSVIAGRRGSTILGNMTGAALVFTKHLLSVYSMLHPVGWSWQQRSTQFPEGSWLHAMLWPARVACSAHAQSELMTPHGWVRPVLQLPYQHPPTDLSSRVEQTRQKRREITQWRTFHNELHCLYSSKNKK